jgi:hypothetical protein
MSHLSANWPRVCLLTGHISVYMQTGHMSVCKQATCLSVCTRTTCLSVCALATCLHANLYHFINSLTTRVVFHNIFFLRVIAAQTLRRRHCSCRHATPTLAATTRSPEAELLKPHLPWPATQGLFPTAPGLAPSELETPAACSLAHSSGRSASVAMTTCGPWCVREDDQSF